MLQANSSPGREAASPPPVRRRYSKKANTFAALQLHEVSCSYTHKMKLQAGSRVDDPRSGLVLEDVWRNRKQGPLLEVSMASFKA
jgi:hypothetical protein